MGVRCRHWAGRGGRGSGGAEIGGAGQLRTSPIDFCFLALLSVSLGPVTKVFLDIQLELHHSKCFKIFINRRRAFPPARNTELKIPVCYLARTIPPHGGGKEKELGKSEVA